MFAAHEQGIASKGRQPRRRRRALIAIVAIAHLLGFASSVDALMTSRTAEGTIAWIVSLNTVPYVAVPAYWVFGRTKFQGYVIARRDLDSELAAGLADKTASLQDFRYLPPGNSAASLAAVERLAKMPFLDGNRVQLLIDGEQTFDSIFTGIDAAQRYLLVQFYIVRADEVGHALQERLIAKAQQGVQVYFLYDEIGSYALPRRYLQELIAAGVNVHWFHSTRGAGNRFQLNFRNHRKIVVADGKRAWVGGLNIGDEYRGLDGKQGHWRDTHLKVEGPAALKLQLSFVEDWYWATEEIPELPWQPAERQDDDTPVLILPSGPADRFETASLMMQSAILGARQRIWITSPYFVPDEAVMSALKLAALAGIDVRVLIPERPDNWLTYFAAYAFLESLLDAGVEIYRYQPGFLHGKAFLVDSDAAAVGTVNLDNRSLRLNFEVTAIALSRNFAAEVEQMFLADFDRSRAMDAEEIRERPLWFRATSRAAYLLAPVL